MLKATTQNNLRIISPLLYYIRQKLSKHYSKSKKHFQTKRKKCIIK
nr:MAG TPA_asm: hypothetical protein [Caudoviricetes sp.]